MKFDTYDSREVNPALRTKAEVVWHVREIRTAISTLTDEIKRLEGLLELECAVRDFARDNWVVRYRSGEHEAWYDGEAVWGSTPNGAIYCSERKAHKVAEQVRQEWAVGRGPDVFVKAEPVSKALEYAINQLTVRIWELEALQTELVNRSLEILEAESKSDDHYLFRAREQWGSEELSIDDGATVSQTEHGAWVQAWVWVEG